MPDAITEFRGIALLTIAFPGVTVARDAPVRLFHAVCEQAWKLDHLPPRLPDREAVRVAGAVDTLQGMMRELQGVAKRGRRPTPGEIERFEHQILRVDSVTQIVQYPAQFAHQARAERRDWWSDEAISCAPPEIKQPWKTGAGVDNWLRYRMLVEKPATPKALALARASAQFLAATQSNLTLREAVDPLEVLRGFFRHSLAPGDEGWLEPDAGLFERKILTKLASLDRATWHRAIPLDPSSDTARAISQLRYYLSTARVADESVAPETSHTERACAIVLDAVEGGPVPIQLLVERAAAEHVNRDSVITAIRKLRLQTSPLQGGRPSDYQVGFPVDGMPARHKTTQARELIMDMLTHGKSVPRRDVVARAEALGISYEVLRRAFRAAGGRSESGGAGDRVWRLSFPNAPPEKSIDQALQFLKITLRDHRSVPYSEILKRAEVLGISDDALRHAGDRLPIRRTKITTAMGYPGTGKKIAWSLP